MNKNTYYAQYTCYFYVFFFVCVGLKKVLSLNSSLKSTYKILFSEKLNKIEFMP